ncbi:MAG: hypothetical protein R6U78_14090 [Bacteroidales bacterium]
MKSTSRTLLFLLLAALPFTLFSQGRTIIAAYMKVPGNYNDYLEIEQAWKKYHQKAVEAGVHNGWQLWMNRHAGQDDPYQFITLQWYDNYEHALGENIHEGWLEGTYTDEEWEELYDKTLDARVYAIEEVSNLISMAENPTQTRYLVVSRVDAKPGMEEDYENMEKDIFKPYHEELIRRGNLSHWGVWNIWPYREGQHRYVIVNGYATAKDLNTPKPWIEPADLGIEYTVDEITKLVQTTREDQSNIEVWELLDAVFPGE